MLDARFIRENAEAVKKNTTERNIDASVVDSWLASDEKRRGLLTRVEEIRQAKNAGSKDMTDEERQKIVALKTELQSVEAELATVQTEWNDLINQIPNMHLGDVPIGATEDENREEERIGEPTSFAFEAKNHADLLVEKGLIDFERGAKVAGSQFYYLQGDLALLEMAVIQFVLNFVTKRGFTPIITPDLARSRFYLGTGYQPRGDEAQTYEINNEDLGLIATSEVTMAGYHADEMLDIDTLPLKYIALSHCFRKEAGAYGKYSKGLYRTHQFTKLGMFIYCREEESEKYHQEILEIEKDLLKELGIPFRVLLMCSGDLGAMAAKKYDVEAWMPGRNDYGEVTSASNCTDYQSRNLNIRYKDGDTVKYAHLLNGTASALSRTIIAIIENNQQEDGSIKVPEALQPFMLSDRTTL